MREFAESGLLCGAAATPSPFETPAASTGALSIFSTPAFGAAQSQPAFVSTLFGGTQQAQQQQQQPGLFGLQPQQQQPQQQLQQSSTALVTKDGKPLSHSTKWEDISPQGQAYLLELECEPAHARPALPVRLSFAHELYVPASALRSAQQPQQ